jgi:Tetracyclin repressor-like, C-terminal domain
MSPPTTPSHLLAGVLNGAREQLGETPVRAVLGLWEAPDGRAALGLIRSAVTNQHAADMMQDFVTRTILGRIVSALDTPDPDYRASLVASQILGLALARRVVQLDALASAHIDDLDTAIGPTMQHYLTGDLRSAPR